MDLHIDVKLPFGALIDGEVHREVQLRPLTLRQSLAAEADGATETPAGLDEDSWGGLCRIARKVFVKGLGRTLTPNELLDLYEADSQVLMDANKELAQRESEFRNDAREVAVGTAAAGEGDGVD